MNIALQYSGPPHWDKAVVQAQFSQLRLPAGARVDVFIGLWREDDPGCDCDHKHQLQAIPADALDIFGSNASLFLLSDFEPNIPPQARTEPGGATPASIYRMHRAIDFANEMRVKHEAEHRRQYDVVIRSRPDLIVTRPIDIARHAPLLAHCMVLPFNDKDDGECGVNDQFAIGNPADMNHYSALYDKLNAYVLHGAALHSQRLLQRHLEEGGITAVYGDFSTALCLASREREHA